MNEIEKRDFVNLAAAGVVMLNALDEIASSDSLKNWVLRDIAVNATEEANKILEAGKEEKKVS